MEDFRRPTTTTASSITVIVISNELNCFIASRSLIQHVGHVVMQHVTCFPCSTDAHFTMSPLFMAFLYSADTNYEDITTMFQQTIGVNVHKFAEKHITNNPHNYLFNSSLASSIA